MSETQPQREVIRMYFDFLKHLTTLSSGSILLLVTLSEKLLKSLPLGQIGSALAAFVASILFSLLCMFVLASNKSLPMPDSNERKLLGVGLFFSGTAFLMGMGLVVVSVFSA